MANYTTKQLDDRYYTFDAIYCGTPDCVTPLPMERFLGIRHKIMIIDEEHYQLSGFFASTDFENSQSFHQTVDIVLDNGTWKVSDFTQQDEDMNILPEEIDSYLMT